MGEWKPGYVGHNGARYPMAPLSPLAKIVVEPYLTVEEQERNGRKVWMALIDPPHCIVFASTESEAVSKAYEELRKFIDREDFGAYLTGRDVHYTIGMGSIHVAGLDVRATVADC